MRAHGADVPRPQTWAQYADAYAANLDEARAKLAAARERFAQFRADGQITERPEGGYLCTGPTAKAVASDYVRCRSDVDHWYQRLTEARAEVQWQKPDARLPPEREAGSDDYDDTTKVAG